MKHKRIFTEYWGKHYIIKAKTQSAIDAGLDFEIPYCGLCGNTGVIEVSPKTPRGDSLGQRKFFCICPNGRAINPNDE